MKHTPGPWKIYRATLMTENDRAETRLNLAEFSMMPNESNARLIEAAPELLEACRDAMRLIDEALPKFDWGRSALDGKSIAILNEVPGRIRTAIAKAEGG